MISGPLANAHFSKVVHEQLLRAPAARLSAFGVLGQNRASASKRTRQTLRWWIGELGRILRL